MDQLVVSHPGFQEEVAAVRRLLRRPPSGIATVVHQDVWGRWGRRAAPAAAAHCNRLPTRWLMLWGPFPQSPLCSNILVAASGPPSTHIIDWWVRLAACSAWVGCQ